MDVYKLFNDLESNNLYDVEETKKKFAETFSLAKEPIFVHGMMDYFVQTSSIRCVDILVKVQSPHDRFIFDRLSDWIKGNNKQHGLELFGHIIRKHPTWLYKIASHPLMKELLKLLKSEKEIIPLMSALFCIINLMPIIPSKISNFLQDLFDVFAHLASWNWQNPAKLPSDLLIHLQIGLYRFFHRLYGMFPCNFLTFLRQEFVINEKSAIFTHTIKPLLDTVKINPLLVTANGSIEIQPDRWKKMEPHDVVFECSKFSLDYLEKPECQINDCYHSNRVLGTPVSTSVQTFDYGTGFLEAPGSLYTYQCATVAETNNSATNQYSKPTFLQMAGDERFMDLSVYDNKLWSPSAMVLATPPPTGTVPHTPTPNTNNANYSAQLVTAVTSQDGSSPPEAAVEATPETTPLKNDHPSKTRPLLTNSTAVRAIWGSQSGSSTASIPGGGSTPSSPMKKEQSPFNFPSEANSVAFDLPPQKIIRLVNDRNQNIRHLQSPVGSGNNFNNIQNYNIVSSIPNSPIPLDMPSHPLPNINDNPSTQEDQEVTEINKNRNNEVILTEDLVPDCDRDCDADGSPCSEGGLHLPDSKSMFNLVARRANRYRMYSHCIGDLSYSTSTSPNDVNNFIDYFGKKKCIKKSNSWPDLLKINASKQKTLTASSILPVKNKLIRYNISNKSNGVDVINNLNLNANEIIVEKFNIGTQTIKQCPQLYEQIFDEIFDENNKIIKSKNDTINNLMTPHAMLEQYISMSIKKKQSAENRNWEEMYRDQIQLLNLQLQYERHRREVHAERNRRLLGKSRANRSLEQHNTTLRDQVSRLTNEILYLNNQSNHLRKNGNLRELEYSNQTNKLKNQLQTQIDENKKMRETIDNLNKKINDEMKQRKDVNLEIETVRGELFDLRNDMRQALYQADLGQQYRQELTRLQSEMILMGEIQMKCKDKLSELNSFKARDTEFEGITLSYAEDIRELKTSRDSKASQLETAKARVSELELQLSRCDGKFTEQKRILKAAKEEYQDHVEALEKKYSAQKAIILKMEETILELQSINRKNQTAVNLVTLSPDSDKTDNVGSLDHTSPLSLSLASSDGLSASVLSELKNLQAFVKKSSNSNFYSADNESSVNTTNENELNIRPVGISDDIPVPSTSHHNQ